ncbi:MAG TPA: Holliday junction branch migration protein RuvA [Microthrixaceae bacterium]|jgi:Holliday junction DNA helicase RuvA|nr:Holliday junction branch migration protein RuvA [Microthrixaceae bacterium]
MIGSLRGTLLDRTGTDVTVEVGGMGYRMSTTPATSGALGVEGSEVFVWVHHHIREDAQTLYGFAGREERDVFETLIGTHGVGPALGLAILSTHSPRALRLALATDDVSALCLVPGVGRKTAQRLLVELKSRLGGSGDVDLRALDADGASPSAATGPSAHADVREALVGLGYGNEEIAGVVGQLPLDGDASDLLRQALQKLAVA